LYSLLNQVLFIPFEPKLDGWPVNVHLILEYVAFFGAYRFYVYLRKGGGDEITNSARLSIILGAAIGAFIGSRLMAYLENPVINFTTVDLLLLFNSKTIMGGLFGGLLGVEFCKWLIGEKRSSGDLFTLPLIVGIFIGRIGCFLAGTNEFTYGIETSTFAGLDLGDGLKRHPLALYELIFLTGLFFTLRVVYRKNTLAPGVIFKLFMLSYFGFRFIIEFMKPNVFYLLGLSSIQWLCVLCFVYYRRTLMTLPRAYAKIHLL
jgi:phosphatidylglycerol---prolipoprotein diacylglyceryl transferase